MKILVQRVQLLDNCTIGYLYIDGKDSGLVTLEPKVQEPKVMGKTAIPKGVYKVVVDHSAHFGKDLPHILDVPNFEGVRIHSGNTDADTEGCILVGEDWHGGDFIGDSRKAFEFVFEQIKAAKDGVEIEIA